MVLDVIRGVDQIAEGERIVHGGGQWRRRRPRSLNEVSWSEVVSLIVESEMALWQIVRYPLALWKS